MNDVIHLGRHKLLCGDATNKEDVETLIGDRTVNLLLTDPPYGIDIVKLNPDGGGESVTKVVRQSHHSGTVGISARPKETTDTWNGWNTRKKWIQTHTHTHTHTHNDGIIEARQYKPVLGDDKPFSPQHLLDLNVPTILFGANNFAHDLPNNSKWLVWYKKPRLDGHRNHFSDCELAWTNMPGKRIDCYHHTWSGMVRRGNRKLELVNRVHPTQKPVGLLTEIIEEYTSHGDVVLDLYGGSGSTLIACEATGRTCLMMELSSDYVEIIQQRYYHYVTDCDDEELLDLSEYNVGGLDRWIS